MNPVFVTIIVVMTIAAAAIPSAPILSRALKSTEQGPRRLLFLVPAFPALAILMYFNIGTPRAAAYGVNAAAAAGRQAAGPAPAKGKVPSVGELVAPLAARLEKNPDDAGGWLLLAKSYRHLGNPQEAATAYRRAADLGKTDADMEAWLGMHTDGGSSATEDRPVEIRGEVQIAGELREALDDDDAVFISAKSERGAGAPLAVIRTTVGALPYQFVMSDRDAMVAGHSLSTAESVVVSAKVAPDGNALSSRPNLSASSAVISTGNPDFVEITIGRRE